MRVPPPDGGNNAQVPGTPVAVALSVEQQAEVDRLQKLLAETKDLTAEQLLSKRAVPWKTALGYDPAKAVNLPLIQGSALKLDTAELAALREQLAALPTVVQECEQLAEQARLAERRRALEDSERALVSELREGERRLAAVEQAPRLAEQYGR